MKNHTLFIVYATALQLITGMLLIITPFPLNVARLGIYYEIFHTSSIGPVVMIFSALLALFALLGTRGNRIVNLLLLFPQQCFLLLTAFSALNYIFLRHYADGILRPWQFIFLDQLPAILIAFLYLLAIMYDKGKL